MLSGVSPAGFHRLEAFLHCRPLGVVNPLQIGAARVAGAQESGAVLWHSTQALFGGAHVAGDAVDVFGVFTGVASLVLFGDTQRQSPTSPGPTNRYGKVEAILSISPEVIVVPSSSCAPGKD